MDDKELPSSSVSQDSTCAAAAEIEHAPEPGHQGQRRQIVQDVLRSHLQEAPRLLNEPDDGPSDPQTWPVAGTRLPCRTDSTVGSASPNFRDIDKEGPKYWKHKYMEMYFRVIRHQVVSRAAYSTYHRDSLNHPADMSAAHPELLHEAARESERLETVPEVNKGAEESKHVPQGCSEATIEEGLRLHAGPASLAGQLVSHDDIWCTLVFRVICWLMLQDFNRQDVQVSKGELLGSRMPVYIS